LGKEQVPKVTGESRR
jgi:hypothetical protein